MAEERTRTFFEGSYRNKTALPKIRRKTDLQKTCMFYVRNGLRAKSGGLRAKNGGHNFQKTARLSSTRALLQTNESWNGKHVKMESL